MRPRAGSCAPAGVRQALDALAELGPGAWLVGGALRDRLLGRATADLDVAFSGDPSDAARAIRRRLRAHVFPLSEAFGAWRVVARDGAWQIDFAPLAGETIEQDLARRDLTINALAEPVGGGEVIDVSGGLDDLAAQRLRMVSEASFTADPLRVVRLARLAAELCFSAEPATVAAARAAAPGLAGSAGERIGREVVRLVASEGVLAGLALLDRVGAAAVVLPELGALRGVGQNRYHHLDVHGHTLEVLERAIELERDPTTWFGEHGPAVAALLGEPLADGITRATALRFGALLHDVAKPATRIETGDGRVGFPRHDVEGAEVVRSIVRRLRGSERLGEHVAALTRHHLRLGFLVHHTPLSREDLFDYLEAAGPVAVDVTALSVADRLATRGDNAERAIAAHLALAAEVIGAALAWRADPPRPPVRGDALVSALGVRPGPELGRLLRELRRASFAGRVTGAAEAIALARELRTPGSD